MDQKQLCGAILSLYKKFFRRKDLNYWGEQMFKLATQEGFPAEFCKDELIKSYDYSTEELAYVVNKYLSRITKHKILSGIYDKNLKKWQNYNNNIMKNILLTGDFETF